MALQHNLAKYGATFPAAYVRVHRVFGSKQEGLTYTIRTYVSRTAYEADLNSHLDEMQFNMPFPDGGQTTYPNACYDDLKKRDGFADCTDVLESGQTPT